MNTMISNIGLIVISLVLVILLGYALYYKFHKEIEAMRTKKAKELTCAKTKAKIAHRNRTDYFWKEYMTFSWITLIFVFSILFGFATRTTWGIVVSILLILLFIYFLRFAIDSYKHFEERAKKRLDEFENQIRDSIKAEISFNGDPIQSFTDEDEEFDTEVKIFEFPTKVKKIAFPPLEKDAKKHKIIDSRKLEFLVLSREYFSICQNATPFSLLEPKLDKKCMEAKGTAGECNEFYYSQMQNVQYDNENECIRIIYNKDTGHEDVTFPCKKVAPNRKPAMKALKEKLRLTERQKLHKIDEHKKYEALKAKREKRKLKENTKEQQEGEEQKDDKD